MEQEDKQVQINKLLLLSVLCLLVTSGQQHTRAHFCFFSNFLKVALVRIGVPVRQIDT